MRVHLIKKKTIEDYATKHPNSRVFFRNWMAFAKQANWNTAADIKITFTKAEPLGRGSNRVVFDIGGNNFRMICRYAFGDKKVHLFICWIGTHAEYTELCNRNQQYTVSIY